MGSEKNIRKSHLTRRATLALPLAVAAGGLLARGARAAAKYPDHAIRIEVGFAPGGGADITARVFGAKLSEYLGQQVLVENRSGASGIIAADYTAKAAPDGYTLLVASSSHGFNPSLYRKLPYDTEKDFAAISLILRGPNILVVHPDFPVHTVADLIKMAKAKPGKLSYASSGNGTAQTMAAELFKQMTGTNIVGIMYRGGAPALVDVVAGQVPLMFGYISSSMPYILGKKLRAIAVTGTTRAPSLPDVPTVAESGVPGYSVYEWNAMFGPAKLPPALVTMINGAVVRATHDPDVQKKMHALGAELIGGTPQQCAEFVAAEIPKWRKVVKAAGIHLD